MENLEFQAQVKDGTIEIPQQYQEVVKQAGTVKVTVPQRTKKHFSETKILTKLSQNPIKVDRFLTREEANDRHYDR
jgi:hypothetical protein